MIKQRRARTAAVAWPSPDRTDPRILWWIRDMVGQVAAFEPAMRALSDAGLAGQTAKLRARLASGERLRALLPEAFASAREAAVRSIGQRPFDVQVMGAAALHLGQVAEMRTGEGKTLAATLPAYLNALARGGVHVLTASEYLAGRDAAWMAPVYGALGLRVGCLAHASSATERAQAYRADVTYGPAAEFAYDYLRDHMAWEPAERVQRALHWAIVDDADVIMIDGARAFYYVTGPFAAHGAELPYRLLAAVAATLQAGTDYTIRPPANITLTARGARSAERQLGASGLADASGSRLARALRYALQALLFQRDRDYVLVGGQAWWTDRVSGRPAGRVHPDGLRLALEVKEGLVARPPERVLAEIAMTEHLKGYRRLAAMTGAATPDASLYRAIYGTGVVVIPTVRPVILANHDEVFFASAAEKLAAVVQQAVTRHATGQPVLIGSGSIEQARVISAMLTEHGVRHEVLIAEDDERDAEAIAGAGRLGAVTVVVAMAGRGVDIALGGPDASAEERGEVASRGGLCVLGADRFMSRRMEMQLQDRAGRRGDPGESQLFASYDDNSFRAIFKPPYPAAAVGVPVGSGGMRSRAVTRSFARGQARSAARTADEVRLQLRFDAVLAHQRRDIYAMRQEVLTARDLSGPMRTLTAELAAGIIAGARGGDKADLRRCRQELLELYPAGLSAADIAQAAAGLSGSDPGLARETIRADVARAYAQREAELGPDVMRELGLRVSLSVIDERWRDHLEDIDALRQDIKMRVAKPRAALKEYREEAGALKAGMLKKIDRERVGHLFHLTVELEHGPAEES